MKGYVITYESPSGRSDDTFMFLSDFDSEIFGVLPSDRVALVVEFFSRSCPGYKVLSVSEGELIFYRHGDMKVLCS